MRVLISISVLLFSFANGILFAQLTPYKCYTADDGLSNSVIYRLCKDKQGFLWLSTNYGLSCFNGHSFINYFPENFKTRFIIGICCDARNRIWATGYSQNDRLLFCIENGKITESVPGGDSLPVYITNLTADATSRIWVTSKDNHAGYISNYNTYKILAIDNNRGFRTKVFTVYPLKDSTVLFGTNGGIYRLAKTNKIALFTNKLPIDSFYAITRDDAGKLYFGGRGKIYTYDPSTEICDSIITANKGDIHNIVVNKPGNIWYNANVGYAQISNKIETDYSKLMSLENVFINDMYSEKGVVFLASGGKGLYVLNHSDLTFYDERSGLKNPLISCIRQHNSDIYVGSFGGVFVYSKDKFVPVKNLELPVSERVNDILFSGDNMWVVTPFSIRRYNLNDKSCSKYLYGGMCLCEDENRNILIGGYDAVVNLNAKSGKPIPPATKSPMVDSRINKIIYSPRSGYWYATSNGLFNYRNNTWKRYDRKDSPLEKGASDVLLDSLENIWVGTPSGLLKFDWKNDKWETFGTKDGLASAFCRHLYMHGGILWIRTPRGLHSFDGKSFRCVSNGYGLPIEDVDVQLVDSRDNSLWITTSKGIYRWNQSEPEKLNRLADVIVRRETDNRISYRQADTVILPYKNNHISFDFVSPNYRMPENIIYEYRLKGANDSFFATNSHNLHFSSLNSGTYSFEIRARLKDDKIYSGVTAITIIVLKPLWQQWWFMLLVSGIIIYAVAFGIVKRIQFIKAREKQKAQRYSRLLQLKQEATNALISPHFIFNSLNSIQHFINQSDVVSANRFLSRFAGLIRATMENAPRTNVRLHDEINILEKYLSLEAIRLPHLTYEINIDDTIDPYRILIPSMLIQPYAENAIWHGITPKNGAGHIKIDIRNSTPPYLQIAIEDNGVGIDLEKKSKSRKSLGMEINKRRLDIIEKLTGHKVEFKIVPLYNDSGALNGTLILLNIPYKIKPVPVKH